MEIRSTTFALSIACVTAELGKSLRAPRASPVMISITAPRALNSLAPRTAAFATWLRLEWEQINFAPSFSAASIAI